MTRGIFTATGLLIFLEKRPYYSCKKQNRHKSNRPSFNLLFLTAWGVVFDRTYCLPQGATVMKPKSSATTGSTTRSRGPSTPGREPVGREDHPLGSPGATAGSPESYTHVESPLRSPHRAEPPITPQETPPAAETMDEESDDDMSSKKPDEKPNLSDLDEELTDGDSTLGPRTYRI
jgi:hypothetical protein